MVLSGQHSSKSLLTLQLEWKETYGDTEMPAPLRFIRADVLKHSTPLEARTLIAGNEQFRQEGTTKIPMSWWCQHFVNSMTEDRTMMEGMSLAVQKAGYRRPSSKVFTQINDARH